MKIIILDTDFIINAIKNHIDTEHSIKELFMDKVEISYIDKTIDELKNKPLEVLAKKYLERFKKITTNKDKSVDNLILELIETKRGIVVATQDKLLKEKLKKRKIQTITIRQQKYINF